MAYWKAKCDHDAKYREALIWRCLCWRAIGVALVALMMQLVLALC